MKLSKKFKKSLTLYNIAIISCVVIIVVSLVIVFMPEKKEKIMLDGVERMADGCHRHACACGTGLCLTEVYRYRPGTSIEGLWQFAQELHRRGISGQEIRQMMVENPRGLLA